MPKTPWKPQSTRTKFYRVWPKDLNGALERRRATALATFVGNTLKWIQRMDGAEILAWEHPADVRVVLAIVRLSPLGSLHAALLRYYDTRPIWAGPSESPGWLRLLQAWPLPIPFRVRSQVLPDYSRSVQGAAEMRTSVSPEPGHVCQTKEWFTLADGARLAICHDCGLVTLETDLICVTWPSRIVR